MTDTDPPRAVEYSTGRVMPHRRLSRRQGQLLAYVFWYTKVHRRPPSENEIADFLRIRGPSAHRMILRLVTKGCLTRQPGQPRTLRVLLPPAELPTLD